MGGVVVSVNSASSSPSGEERQTRSLNIAAVDGAPVSYIVSLAAVVAVLAMIPIPISIVIGSGRNFPMSQSVYALVGWLLGPIAGAVANGVGAVIGVIIAPHTTSYAPATILGAVMGGLASGTMIPTKSRRIWWLPLSLVFLGLYSLYAGRAVLVNRASWVAVLLASFINWSAILLYILPTRTWFARQLQTRDSRRIGLGLFGGTWMVAGLVHLSTGAIVYSIINWPNELWWAIVPLAPLEHAIRGLAAMGIGLGVISGLRATGLVKPPHAAY